MGVPPIHPKLGNFSLGLKPMVTWAPFCGFFWSVVDCCRLVETFGKPEQTNLYGKPQINIHISTSVNSLLSLQRGLFIFESTSNEVQTTG